MNRQDKRAIILGEEDVRKGLIYLAIPSIVGMVINGVYNIVDTIFVGRLGTSAIGALSVAFPFLMLISAFGIAVGVGSASYISRSLGAGQKEEAERTAATGVGMILGLGIILITLGQLWLEPVMRLFGATDTILPHAMTYARTLLFGAPIIMLKMTLNNILRAEGSAHASMIALISGAVLNMILDPIFIFTLNMGIQGAAVATVLAQSIAVCFQLWYYFSGRSYLKLSPSLFQPSKAIVMQIVKIGIPSILTLGLNSMAMALINNAAAPYGDYAVAAMGIVKRVMSLGMFTIFGYGQGFQPMAGFNYGAKNFGRLNEAIRFSVRITTAFTFCAATLFIIFSETVISWFSTDPLVLQTGAKALRAISIPFPLFGFQIIYFSLFQALGKAIPAGILSVSRQGLLLIPAIIILPRFFDLDGVIFAQPTADGLTIIMTIILGIMINKQLDREAREHLTFINQEIAPAKAAKELI